MTAREPAVLGLDLGTTEVKAGVVSLDGRLLALAERDEAGAVRPVRVLNP